MKKVIAILSFVVLAGTTQVVSAQVVEGPVKEVAQQDEKVKITVDELPAAVKKTLEGVDYEGWNIETVLHNKTKDSYELQVKKDADEKTLKFDKEGNSIV